MIGKNGDEMLMERKTLKTINRMGIVFILFGTITWIELMFVLFILNGEVPLWQPYVVAIILATGLAMCIYNTTIRFLERREVYV
jgi:hypothetical protein